MRKIKLTHGFVALVDDQDFEEVSKLKWRAFVRSHTVYAVRTSSRLSPVRKTIYLHRFIMGLPDEVEVDHRNGNGLDNRRKNLRPATRLNNLHNSKVKKNSKTGLKGVHLRNDMQKYQARIRYGGKRHIIGYFHTAQEAHKAYCATAVKIQGQFAKI